MTLSRPWVISLPVAVTILAASALAQPPRHQQLPEDEYQQAPDNTAPAVSEIDNDIARIRDYKRRIAWYRQVLARQRRIGEASGYVDKETSYQSGALLIDAEDHLRAAYREYRLHGGKKPLGAL